MNNILEGVYMKINYRRSDPEYKALREAQQSGQAYDYYLMDKARRQALKEHKK